MIELNIEEIIKEVVSDLTEEQKETLSFMMDSDEKKEEMLDLLCLELDETLFNLKDVE